MSVVAIAGAGGALGPVVVERLRAAGHDVDAPAREEVDVLSPAAVQAWVARLGRVDALVHLVGGWRGGALLDEAPAQDWDWLAERLIRTVQVTTRAFAPALRAAGGRFVLIGSTQVARPDAKNAAYAAAKAAAETWTLAFARDLAEHGGTANVVAITAIGESPASFTPAADIAEAIALLLGEHGGRVNGQRIELHA